MHSKEQLFRCHPCSVRRLVGALRFPDSGEPVNTVPFRKHIFIVDFFVSLSMRILSHMSTPYAHTAILVQMAEMVDEVCFDEMAY